MHDFEMIPGRAAHRLYAHVVWPTLGRIPLITADTRNALERHLIVLCRRLDAEPLCVRVLADRAHVLLRFKPGHAVATLVSRLKAGSETALNAEGHAVRWGRGYAAASIGGDEVRQAKRRIVRLPELTPSSMRQVLGPPLPTPMPASARPPVRPRSPVDAPNPSR